MKILKLKLIKVYVLQKLFFWSTYNLITYHYSLVLKPLTTLVC
jgi:hypothetical protein